MVSTNWTNTTLGELVAKCGAEITTGPFGTKLKAAEYTRTGAPLISVKEIQLGRIEVDDRTPCVPRSVQDAMPEYLLRTGDIVFARKGGIERSAWVPPEQDGYFLGSDGLRVRFPASIDSRFIAYQFRSATIQDWLIRHSTGSTMASLSGKVLTLLPLTLPPLDEQRRIAAVLGALDDKIELNRKMNRTLEELAQALFKSWFIDFDGHDDLVDSEIGPVPRGWEIARAAEVADVWIGKTPPRKEPHWFSTNPADVRWMSIKDLGACGAYITQTAEYLTHEAVDRHRVKRIPDNTVVLSFKLTVGRVAITEGEMCSNEAIAHFRLPEGTPLTPEYLYSYLKMFRYDDLGSTSSIATAVNSKVIQAMPVLVPERSAVARYGAAVQPIFRRLKCLAHESRTLADLRDTLLPKLISGELRVPEAEGLVEAKR